MSFVRTKSKKFNSKNSNKFDNLLKISNLFKFVVEFEFKQN